MGSSSSHGNGQFEGTCAGPYLGLRMSALQDGEAAFCQITLDNVYMDAVPDSSILRELRFWNFVSIVNVSN